MNMARVWWRSYYSYGATADGASTSGTSSAYGPKFDGQSFYQYDPVRQSSRFRAYSLEGL